MKPYDLFSNLTQELTSWFLPFQCLGCNTLDPSRPHDDFWCESCLASLQKTGDSPCRICGLPKDAYTFAPYHQESSTCSSCLESPPAFDTAHAPWRYEGALRHTIPKAKYASSPTNIETLSKFWAPYLTHCIETLQEPSRLWTLTCVPMHTKTLRKRGQDPTRLLFEATQRHLPKHLDLSFDPHILTKTRHTRPQAGLTMRQRRANLQNAYTLHPNTDTTPRFVILIDDVMTTGSTAHEISKTLKQHGTQLVAVFTIARAIVA